MATATPFRIHVADLVKRSGASRAFEVRASLAGLVAPAAEIPADAQIDVEGTLEQVTDGIVVRSTITAPWTSPCSRCLAPVTGDISVRVDELFERHPIAGETYPLIDDVVDLEPLLRDALLLELPGAPVCRPDCAGLCPTCGIDRNDASCDCHTDDIDPRWAALRSLDL